MLKTSSTTRWPEVKANALEKTQFKPNTYVLFDTYNSHDTI